MKGYESNLTLKGYESGLKTANNYFDHISIDKIQYAYPYEVIKESASNINKVSKSKIVLLTY